MAGMFDDLVPDGSKPKAEKGGGGSGPWEDFNGPWTAYQGGAFDDLIPKPQEKSGLMRRAVGDTAVSAVKGAVGLVEAGIGLADIPTFGKAGQAAEAIGIRTKDAKAALDDLYSPEQKAANKAVSEAEGFIGTAKTALQNPSTIGHAVIESAPLLLPGAAIARGIGAAGRLAPAVAGGIGEGVVGAGMAAEQMRQNSEDGTLSGRQMGAALASGAGTAAFGIAGGKLAQSAIGKKLGMADVDTALAMNPAQRAAAGGVDSGLVKRIAGGAVSEGVLEELPQSMWEQAAQNYGEGKPLGEGVAEAGAMGMLAGGVMGGGFNALQGRQKKDDKPATGTEESPTLALPAPTYTGTPADQTLAADVDRANQVAAAQANADQVYAERAAFEQQHAPEKLPVTGPLSAAVNVGIDAGATSITSPANPRFDVPAEPRGSFAQQAELARLIEEERADADDRRELAQLVSQERRDQSRRIAEASEQRQALEDALADADQRVAGAAAQESEAARLRLLDSVLVDAGESGNPARQFGNALRRAGYRNTDFTEREQQTIQRFTDARAALNSPEATTVPAAPNELDPEAVGIRERTGGQQNTGAVLRDKPAEVVDLLSQGWKPVGKTLISPKGKRRNLNAEEFAAVREARGKKSNQQAGAALVGAQQQVIEAGNGLQEGGLEEKADPANQLQAEAAMPDSANQTVINSALAPDPGQVTDGADSRAEFKKAQVDLGTALRDFAPASRMVPENTPELMPTLTRLFKASVGEVGINPKDLIAHVKKQLKAEQETKAIWNKVGNNIYQKAALQAVADVTAHPGVSGRFVVESMPQMAQQPGRIAGASADEQSAAVKELVPLQQEENQSVPRAAAKPVRKWSREEVEARLMRADSGEAALSDSSRKLFNDRLAEIIEEEAQHADEVERKAAQAQRLKDAREAARGTFLVGPNANDTERVSVRDGVVYLGAYPAVDFDTGEDVIVADGAKHEDIVKALVAAGAISPNAQVFGRKKVQASAGDVAGGKRSIRFESRAAAPSGAEAEFAATERAYGGRESYDRAKVNGKTKLNYRQWVQVRTPKFKEWFGDWEALRAQDRLDSMTPVKVRVPDEWRELSHTELRGKMAEALDRMVKQRTEINHPDLGEIRVGRTGANKSLGTARDPAKSLVAADIEALIPSSIYARTEPSRGGDGPDIDGYSTLLARVSVDDVPLIAAFTVRHQSDGRWYYNAVTLHDAQEKAQDSYGRPDQKATGSRFAPITGLDSFIRQPLRRVNPDSVSKVTDRETGEPLVVYHGTTADISTPDPKMAQRLSGFWVTPGRKIANTYAASGVVDARSYREGANVMPLFVKVTNPRIYHPRREPISRAWGDYMAGGYDGFFEQQGGGFYAASVPDAAQIKSATGNNGDFDPANPDIRESRAEQKPLNAHQKFVKNIVEKAADKFKAEYSGAAALDIRVVYSRDEIPSRYRPSPYAEGVYHDREGIIYLVASNMPTKQRAWQVLMHEAVGHYGLANMMGEDFSDLWPTVLQRASLGRPLNYDPMPGEKHYETVEAVRRLYPEASDSEIAQEVLARMAETMPKINWFRFAMLRIQRWISGVAERFGVKLSMSMDDVRGLVQLAGEHLRRGANLDREQAGDQVAFASQRASAESRATPFMNVLDAGDSAIAALDGWLDRNTRMPDEWTAQQKDAAGKFATFSPRQPVKSMVRGINNRMKDRAAQLIFDQFRPLKKLSEEAFMQAHLSKATDGALEAVATLGIPVLRDGALAVDKQDDGGFIGALVKKLGNAQEVNQFLMWVAANRAEKLAAEGRENLFTPEDIAAMKGFSKGKMDDGRPRPVAYAEAHSRLKAYNKAVLDIAEQAGLIDGEARKNWESDFYIPFYRVSEETGEMDFSAGGTGLVRQKVIKQLKGGTDNLGDPLANIMANWHILLTASMRNMASNRALEQGQSMGIADRVEMPSQAVPAAKGGTWTMKNGQKVLWQVHDPMVAEALEALNFTGYNNPAMRAAGKFKHMLTMGVTISPTFRIRNLMRDALQAVATADVGYNPLKNAVDGWKLTANDSGTMAQLIAGGGAVRFGSFNDGQQAEYAKRMIAMGIKDNQILNTTDKLKNFFRRFYDSYQESGDRAETINRAVIYERVLNETGSHLKASFAARDLMNFTSMGSSAAIRALAQVLPFFNARLQGMDRLVRGAAADPRRFWSVAGVIGMASALLYLLQGDDDEYKALPDYVRDAYWPVKLGGMWAYIPKPFEVGALGTVVERFTELMMAGDDYQARDFRDTMVGVLANTLAMNPVPQIVKPIGEAWFNYDMFRGQAIDSMAMERLLPQERFNANTSAAAVGVGRALEVSPQKVEHLVRGYFGWLGTQALNVGDLMARPFMDMPASPKRDMSSVNNWLVAGDLFKDAGTAPSKYVERYYRVQREINAIYATASQARNLGNMDQYNELMNRPEMAARPLIKNADRQITQINQRMRAVMASQDLSVEQKNEMLTELRLRREGVARQVDEAARARAQ